MTIILSDQIEAQLSKRRYETEEISDLVVGEQFGDNIYCLFSLLIARGSPVDVDSPDYNERALAKIQGLVEKFPDLEVLFSHSHHIGGLSSTDRSTMRELSEKYGWRYALVVTPTQINAYKTENGITRPEALEVKAISELPTSLPQLAHAYLNELINI